MIADIAYYFSLPVISISIIIMLARLIKGPGIEDRIVALDLITTSGIGFLGAYSIAMINERALDVAVIIALLGFLGTLAFAYFLERRHFR